VKIRIIDFLL